MRAPFPLLLIVTGILMASCSEQEVADGPSPDGLNWHTNILEAKSAAIKEKKPLMMDFRADWCGWCREYEKTTFQDPAVKKLFDNVILVKVDTDKMPDLAREYQASTLPMILFTDKDGKPFHAINGYLPADPFRDEFLRAISKFKG